MVVVAEEERFGQNGVCARVMNILASGGPAALFYTLYFGSSGPNHPATDTPRQWGLGMQYNKITVSDRNERTKTADLVPVHATCGYQCVHNCAKHAPNDEKSNEGSSLSSHSSSTTGTGFENALVHAGRHATEFSTWLPACQTEDCGERRTHNMLLISQQGTGNK